jgi:hypothetical protein
MSAITIAEAARASENRISKKETIEIRSLCPLSSKGETERLAQYLCASERERAARFHFQADYDRYVAARAALRLQLSAFLDCDPKAAAVTARPADLNNIHLAVREIAIADLLDERNIEGRLACN